MSVAAHEQIDINWGERHIVAELRRTPRRVLRVDITPSGDVVVFAPTGENIETVHSRVKRKCPWIFRELDRIENRPVVTPPRQFHFRRDTSFIGQALPFEPRTGGNTRCSVGRDATQDIRAQ